MNWVRNRILAGHNRVKTWITNAAYELQETSHEESIERLDNFWVWIGVGVLVCIAVYTVPILKNFISQLFNWLWTQIQSW